MKKLENVRIGIDTVPLKNKEEQALLGELKRLAGLRPAALIATEAEPLLILETNGECSKAYSLTLLTPDGKHHEVLWAVPVLQLKKTFEVWRFCLPDSMPPQVLRVRDTVLYACRTAQTIRGEVQVLTTLMSLRDSRMNLEVMERLENPEMAMTHQTLDDPQLKCAHTFGFDSPNYTHLKRKMEEWKNKGLRTVNSLYDEEHDAPYDEDAHSSQSDDENLYSSKCTDGNIHSSRCNNENMHSSRCNDEDRRSPYDDEDDSYFDDEDDLPYREREDSLYDEQLERIFSRRSGSATNRRTQFPNR